MKTNFGLHIIIDFKTVSDFENSIKLLNNESKKYIWLKGGIPNIKPHILALNHIIQKTGVLVITDSEELLEEGLNLAGFICADFKDQPAKKNQYTHLKIGGIAHDVADAKNIELYKGDFVYMGPINDIGTMPYMTLIPEKPDYEWRFLDITIPIIGFGKISGHTLEAFSKQVNLSGFSCHENEFKNLSNLSLRFLAV